MASTRDKPTDPDVDFGDLNEDATGEFARKKPASPRAEEPAPTPVRPPPLHGTMGRSTRPAPPADPLEGWAATRSPSRARALEDLEFATTPANRVSPAALEAMQTSEPDEDSADEELFGKPGAGAERATRRAPSAYPARTPTQPVAVAPPPPKLPTLPDIEFTMGLPKGPPSDLDDLPPVLGVANSDDWGDLGATSHALPMSAAAPTELELELADPVVGEPGDAHSLVERANSLPPPPAPSPDPQRELSERFALGDFSGALVVAEAMLVEQPDHGEATRVASECRAKLQAMYLSRLGPMDQVPALSLPRAELKWLSLDHRAGFVLSLVDGTSSMEEIIDVAGMPTLEVLRVLFDLHNQRAIEFRARSRR